MMYWLAGVLFKESPDDEIIYGKERRQILDQLMPSTRLQHTRLHSIQTSIISYV